jgi:hypothetical protein
MPILESVLVGEWQVFAYHWDDQLEYQMPFFLGNRRTSSTPIASNTLLGMMIF